VTVLGKESSGRVRFFVRASLIMTVVGNRMKGKGRDFSEGDMLPPEWAAGLSR